MSNYHRADCETQWFQDDHPGSVMEPNVTCLHTTEGTNWPGYNGGAVAPNYTGKPNIGAKRLDWRGHFPDERSSRALVNSAGGVETNTLNVEQVELIGTCNPAHAQRWGNLRAGVDYIYWPDAPDWALQDVADFLADQNKRHGTPLVAPKFRPYPASYGANNGVRFTDSQWRQFKGVCGHQHIPENLHGDPGAFPIEKVLAYAKDATATPVVPRREVKPSPNVDAVLAAADKGVHANKGERKKVFQKIVTLARSLKPATN